MLKPYGTVTVPGALVERTELVQTSVPSDATVDAWFAETFHNLALPTELYARFFAAKERLKAALRPAVPAAPAEE